MNDEPEKSEPDEESRRAPLIALVLVIVLVIGGIFLTQVLSSTSKIQDCVMAGRNNCAPISSGG